MKKMGLLILLVFVSGCFTARKIDRERRVFQLQAKDGAIMAGVDVFGLKEAMKADPAGTSGAITLDAVMAAGAVFLADYVKDQMEGDSKSGDKNPGIQADFVIYNSGSGSVNYSPIGGSNYE